MKVSIVSLLGLVGSLSVAAGCDGSLPPQPPDVTGTLSAALSMTSQHDVTAVRFDVVAATAACDATPLATQTTAIEAEALPGSVAGMGAGAHAFADGLFVLPPGDYRICATPLAGDTPSQQCARASTVATVVSQQTNEVVLVSQCAGAGNGGLDVVVTLNDPPLITALSIKPSKFITTCESATIAVGATDPNGDAVTYTWSIVSGPAGASLTGAGSMATFSGGAGDYVLQVVVTDVYAATASLSFPIHVSAAVCAVPDAVQAIFAQRCSPCHTVNSSGGLHLDPAAASFANLVGVHAGGAGCMDQVRVVPGNAAASYLVAKLLGTPGICGVRMPRNQPPLPDAEIATIQAWINGLPH